MISPVRREMEARVEAPPAAASDRRHEAVFKK